MTSHEMMAFGKGWAAFATRLLLGACIVTGAYLSLVALGIVELPAVQSACG